MSDRVNAFTFYAYRTRYYYIYTNIFLVGMLLVSQIYCANHSVQFWYVDLHSNSILNFLALFELGILSYSKHGIRLQIVHCIYSPLPV